jgi:hypothetical protein
MSPPLTAIMKEPTNQTIKRLFARSGNTCAFPGCRIAIVEDSGIITGEICHINAQSPNGPRYDPNQTDEQRHGYDNLILLCDRHHKIADAQPNIYDVQALKEMKSIHETSAGREEVEQDVFYARILLNDFTRRLKAPNSVFNLMVASPGAIQANTINVRTPRKNISLTPPIGTIGTDAKLTGYIQHLIKRYNKFANVGPTKKDNFSHGAVSGNIEDRFGCPWRLLPLHKADEVVEYLQWRISRTAQAKNNKVKGWKAFSTYDEWLLKYSK